MRDRSARHHQIGGPERSGRADSLIAALAGQQHGVVSRAQLLAAGVSRRQIERRVERSILHIVHRSVYSVGHDALSQEGRWMAAVLAGGPGAALGFWSAASLLRLRPGRGPRSHVTCPRKRKSLSTITFHFADLPPDETTVERDIPCTTPARTLIDLAPLLRSPTLARMLDAAPSRGAPLVELLDRYPRKPGAPKLRALLAEPIPMTRSDFEAHVLARIEAMGLPRPEVNAVVEGYECDLVWWESRVIAELDSYVTHGSRTAFELDRERDRKLTLAEWQVARITDARTDEGLSDLSRLLAATAARSRAAA